jgi:predicted DsbA family dithiol-disulfide isomerase
MALLEIVEYTDPGCPFAWSAEPIRRRLQWLYGDQIDWRLCMVGLADSPRVYEEKGFTPERQAASFKRLSEAHHMPMDTAPRPRMAATLPACRAVVAARRHRPEQERSLLRALRRLHFGGALLDDPDTLRRAAAEAALDPGALERWMAEPETEQALQEDLESAREPAAAAQALDHKLAQNDGGYRYTCPSYEITRVSDGASAAVPGFQPLEAYEVAISNLCPEIERRPDPESVEEVIAWAGEPLATAEVAAVSGIELEDAREQLGRVAEEEHVGFDGFWTLASGVRT